MRKQAPTRSLARSGLRRLSSGLAAAVLGGACLVVSASTSQAAPLEIAIGYSRSFDATCSFLRGYRIDREWRDELEGLLPEARQAWQAEGRPVLERVLQITGKRLEGGRHDVRLTLCDLPSSSLVGPVVNMRHALPAFTKKPVPLRYKAGVIAHELLHGLVGKLDLSGSRMLAAHAREPERVRSHLHLFALMKAALLDLDRVEALDELQRIDSSLPSGAYRRSWQIVNATPDAHLAYLEEVRLAR